MPQPSPSPVPEVDDDYYYDDYFICECEHGDCYDYCCECDYRRPWQELVRAPIGSEVVYRSFRTNPGNGFYYTDILEVHMDTEIWIMPNTASTMLPIRFIGYALGLDVHWCEPTRTGTLDPEGRNLQFTVDSDYMMLGGVQRPIFNVHGMRVPAILRDDRIFIPLRAMGEALGLQVDWLDEVRIATLLLYNGYMYSDENGDFDPIPQLARNYLWRLPFYQQIQDLHSIPIQLFYPWLLPMPFLTMED